MGKGLGPKKQLMRALRALNIALLNGPPRLVEALAGPPVYSPEGYKLDAQIGAIVRIANKLGLTRWGEEEVGPAREHMERSARLLSADPKEPCDAHKETIDVAGGTIRVRVYRPRDAGKQKLPLIVFFHGGGFVLGSVRSHDGECRALAVGCRAVVVSVGYRLAPEHPFPTAPEDCLAAYRWAITHADGLGADPSRSAVAGDSAGGNLAAVTALATRRDAVRPKFQLLVYPATDMTRSFASHEHFREGFLLTRRATDWFLGAYLRSEDQKTDPRASPLFEKDLSGAPPAFVMTAGFDPLRDEGKAYADALGRAGVPVQHTCYESLVHGFFSMSGGVRASQRAMDDAIEALRSGLSG